MTNRWRIELLGGFRVARQGQDDFRFATRKTAALLAYLAFYPQKSWGRETLADQFWPDHEPESARNSLRVALNALRKLFDAADCTDTEYGVDGEGAGMTALLVTDRASVRLSASAFSTDVSDFESLLRVEQTATDPQARQAALLEAAELYRGPLLPGWYEEWIGGEQTRLAEAYAGALRRLTGIFTDAKDFDRAFLFARRAVQDDPLREENHRLLIRLHALTGNVNSALSQYRELESRLRDELSTTPSRVTRELVRQILSADRADLATAKTVVPEPAPRVASSVRGAGGAPTPPAGTADADATPAAPLRSPAPPRPLTRFFGREDEIERLTALLSPETSGCCRLITLTGMGGTGKTRLALEAASYFSQLAFPDAGSAAGFTGGVWFVPLADVARPSGLAAGVAAALTVRSSTVPPDTAEASSWDQIVATLSPSGKPDCPTLLVLDNFEQLVEGADWVARLMRAAPGLSCLITSRQRLGLAGEQELPLAPLPSPPAKTLRGPAALPLPALEAYPSVRLWIDRARAVRPDFQLNARNAPAVAELIAGLDGLPLALELSAAWARLLTPVQMVERLHSRFDLLVAAGRDISPRHRSLRAVLEETCGLLPPLAQTVFASLSVFRGGWTLDAAQTVCASGQSPASALAAGELLETLALLQDRSLIIALDGVRQVRFRMLETVREFAASRLPPADASRAKSIHARHFAAFARDAAPHLNRHDAEEWLMTLDEEQDNVQAALDFSESHGTAAPEMPSARAFAGDLWRYWYARGRADHGLAVLEKYVGQTGQASSARSACEGAGRLALALGQASRAGGFLQQGLLLSQNAPEPDATGIIALAANLALAARAAGDEQTACAAHDAVLRQQRHRGDLWGVACAQVEIGSRLLHLRNNDGARAAFGEAQRLCTLLGDEWGADECRAGCADADNAPSPVPPARAGALARSYLTLGHVACEQEDFTVALPLLEEARTGFLQSGSEGGITLSLERIGLAALGTGELPRARRALEDARARRASRMPDADLQAHLRWLDGLLARTA